MTRLDLFRRPAALALAALTVGLAGAAAYGVLGAADHTDAPLIAGDQAADIADVYSFRSPTNPDNIVLAMTISNVQAAPQIRLGRSIFDPEVLYQFKIDKDGDAVEDLLIQAFVTGNPQNQVMHFRGPAAPEVTGSEARVLSGPESGNVRVSSGPGVVTRTRGEMSFFAGVRDDPFFFDLGQFVRILAGEATGFNDPGNDSFAGLNVYAIVVELPIESLGTDTQNLTVWGTTSRPM